MARSVASGLGGTSDRLMIILAVIFAIAAAVLVFVILSNVSDDDGETTPAPAAGSVAVVTATGNIGANTRITDDMLEVTQVPAALALAGGYEDATALVGLTTRVAVAEGEQITQAKLGETAGDDDSLSLIVPPGLRAISIPASEESIVGGLILPGDIVDIIAVFDASDAGIPKATTIVQNVEVLAVAQEALEFVPPPVDADAEGEGVSRGQVTDNTDPQPDADTVTLAVTLQQAQILALTSENATLWLVLRSRGDSEEVSIGAIDFEQLGIVSPVADEVAP